jgi:hypothetical protein
MYSIRYDPIKRQFIDLIWLKQGRLNRNFDLKYILAPLQNIIYLYFSRLSLSL